MRWVTFSNLRAPADAPTWMLTAGLNDEGIVFVPAMLFGTEGLVYNCAQEEGIECVEHNLVTYVPAPWIAELVPEYISVLEKITRLVIHHFDPNDGEGIR